MPASIIGIMSGSSLDGLDIAQCRFEEANGVLTWDILNATTISFPEHIAHALKNAPTISGFDLMQLDADFGKFIGVEVNKWMDEHGIKIDCIASHGHTVFHEPAKGFTTQIGSGAHIAFETGIDTITSFRNADVAAGGQGAPFAPIADKTLFPGFDGYLNLGGIANITLNTQDGNWHAWDIGPCNQALNFLSQLTGKPFDEDGKMAATAKINNPIVSALLEMFPYNAGKPFGLSNAKVKSTWINYLEGSKENPVDLLASTSETISQMIVQHISPLVNKGGKILVTGGGAHNVLLIQRIKTLAKELDFTIEIPAQVIIDFKESLLMAYLGYLTMQGSPYGIKDVSGATTDSIGGALFKALR